MEEGLREKTGKTLDEWIAIVNREDLAKHGEILKFLKTEHGMTHGFANFVALKARSADAASHDPDDLVASQYDKKQELRPIYEDLRARFEALGDDVKVVPKKSAVSFVRKTQFALVQPTTKTRIDLGLKIKDKEPGGRLEGSGPFGSMCTHRVQLTGSSDIDAELMGWVKEAYDKAG